MFYIITVNYVIDASIFSIKMNPVYKETMTPCGDCIINSTKQSASTKENNTKISGKDGSSSYEVFRNNTTAVEVIIKQVSKKLSTSSLSEKFDEEIKSLHEENEELFTRLNRNRVVHETEKNNLKKIIIALNTQLSEVNKEELYIQTQNINLNLENEKLKTILESKTSFIKKLIKELDNLKRIIKILVKNSCKSPRTSISISTDVDYEDFKMNLNKEFCKHETLNDLVEKNCAIDSFVSKDTSNTI